MKIDGGCHCGAIKYEAEADPNKVVACHCTDCQNMSGSPFRVNVFVDESNLTFLSGKPTEYVKTAESGNKRAQGFCGSCGSALYATNAEGPRMYGLRAGSINQRDQLAPKRQVWLRSRLHWLSELDNVPGSELQQ